MDCKNKLVTMKKLIFISLLFCSQISFGQANTNPLFGLKPFINTQKITTATVATKTLPTTNLKIIATGGIWGTKVDWVKFSADSICSAAIGFLAVSDTAGANPQYFGGVVIPATNVSTTANGAEVFLTYGNPIFVLHQGQILYAGATVIGSGSNICVSSQIANY